MNKFPEIGWMKERFQVITLNNEICEFDWIIEPGGSVPRHLHKDSDETFKVLEGALTVSIGNQTVVKQRGEEWIVPKMTPHSVSNKTDSTVTCRVAFQPVADQGKFFRILFFLHGLNPNDKSALFKAMYISECLNYREFSTMQGGMKILMRAMMGIFHFFTFLTRWDQLVKKYVQTEMEHAVMEV